MPLKSLGLCKNSITYEGVVAILALFPNLTHFDVSQNPIPSRIELSNINEGVFMTTKKATNAELSILATHIGILKSLVLNQCTFDDTQVDWIIKFLRNNHNLEKLYLKENSLSNSRAEFIEIAENNPGPLKILDLSDKFEFRKVVKEGCATLIL